MAYAAKDSLPNEPLYVVKLAEEDLQLMLTSDTTARISLLTIFANRRADDATILATQGQPVPQQVSALIDEYQDEIVALSASLEDEEIPVVGIQKRPQDQENFAGNPVPVLIIKQAPSLPPPLRVCPSVDYDGQTPFINEFHIENEQPVIPTQEVEQKSQS